MAKRPLATNDFVSTKLLFKERRYYNTKVLTPETHRNLIDLWTLKSRDYGKVNYSNQKIRIDTRFLKELNSKSNAEEAFNYFNGDLASKYAWDLENELVTSLKLLVARRFK